MSGDERLMMPVETPVGTEIRQQVGVVQRWAEKVYDAARALRDAGHYVAASGLEDAAFSATLWSDVPVARGVAPDMPSAPSESPAEPTWETATQVNAFVHHGEVGYVWGPRTDISVAFDDTAGELRIRGQGWRRVQVDGPEQDGGQG